MEDDIPPPQGEELAYSARRPEQTQNKSLVPRIARHVRQPVHLVWRPDILGQESVLLLPALYPTHFLRIRRLLEFSWHQVAVLEPPPELLDGYLVYRCA